MADEGEDEDIVYVDAEDIEDVEDYEDFEYEEDGDA
jgi:GTP-binding protein